VGRLGESRYFCRPRRAEAAVFAAVAAFCRADAPARPSKALKNNDSDNWHGIRINDGELL
jgi:hypothetical protein